MKHISFQKIFLLSILFSLVFGVSSVSADDFADEGALTTTITCSNGVTADQINISYYTFVDQNYGAVFYAGDTITVQSDTPMDSLYICWNNRTVSEWTLTLEDGTVQNCGKKGYLHEYVKLDHPSSAVTITIGADRTQIVKLCAFGEGELPYWVQVWDEPCKDADILLVSTHADDEQLFFGAVLPYYAGELGLRVQLVYFCNYWNNLNIREHEKLDGLWEVGVRNYPINGSFDDLDVSTGGLEDAKAKYDYSATVGFIVEQIRRFKPLVIVGQDFNGEYGHGAHRMTAAAIAEALELSNDPTKYPESADTYGTYDVPKAYFHLYETNMITLDCQRPLSHFDNKTVLEMARLGYLRHRSQQWCYFKVVDVTDLSNPWKPYLSCADYGLYRSLVGEDTENDMLCNLITYEEAERLAAEQESIEASIAESVAESIATETSIAESKEAESVSIRESEEESRRQYESESEEVAAAEAEKVRTRVIVLVVIVVALTLLILIFGGILFVNRAGQKRRKKRKITK